METNKTKSKCGDPNCPVCGHLSIRGNRATGIVISNKGKKTVVVERETIISFPKYKRYAKRKSKIPAHNSACINAQLGDVVEIAECRKISKTKAWAVVKILKKKGEEQ